MPEMCYVVGCHNQRGDNPGVTFHRFTANPERRSEWIVNRKNWYLTECMRLCGVFMIYLSAPASSDVYSHNKH